MHSIAINDALCYINGEFTRASIGIDGKRISKVSKQELKGKITFTGKNMIVIPAFFNAHTHAAMTLLRGAAEDLELSEWLRNVWRLERKMTASDIYWGTMLAIVEMIRSGIAGFSDLYIFMDEVAKAVGESGVRAVLCYGMADRGDEEKARRELEIGEKFIRDWNNSFDGRITAIYGPHAPYTCTPDFLRTVKERADKIGTRIHIHVSETQWEVEEIKSRYGTTPVRLLDRIGFLDSNVVIAHGVWLDDEEIEILRRRGVSVVHNPVSNLKLSSGIARVRDMLERGINVALGSDGVASNNSFNFFQEMKFASLLQKVKYMRADAVKARDVMDMATANGYAAYGIEGGRIEEGYLADLAILSKSPQFYPSYNPLYSLVYSASGEEVQHLIVNGEIVMEDRVVLTIDEEKVTDKVEKIKEKFTS
ncbi:Cytosine deaminase [Geoglobus ahangari]|uniref:5-methylthioadenosine/S-adenosylhomocysteine deaminase n=1 Tax=Geoglobus ahangari TaxID=113653 RepID=A0A0F7II05_9EURY|nr:amidohydrolase [Geoglobus ahangari]AKG91663.1 Cytosine deaminase [Geoglobus ahangari]